MRNRWKTAVAVLTLVATTAATIPAQAHRRYYRGCGCGGYYPTSYYSYGYSYPSYGYYYPSSYYSYYPASSYSYGYGYDPGFVYGGLLGLGIGYALWH